MHRDAKLEPLDDVSKELRSLLLNLVQHDHHRRIGCLGLDDTIAIQVQKFYEFEAKESVAAKEAAAAAASSASESSSSSKPAATKEELKDRPLLWDGADQLRGHPFFSGVDWTRLTEYLEVMYSDICYELPAEMKVVKCDLEEPPQFSSLEDVVHSFDAVNPNKIVQELFQ